MTRRSTIGAPVAVALLAMAVAGCRDATPARPTPPEPLAPVVVDYPREGSLFPREFVAPTFLWHDDHPEVQSWAVDVTFADGAQRLTLEVPGDPPTPYPADPRAFGATNEPYEGTEYQRSARSWTPERTVWEDMKRRSVEQPMTVTFTGLAPDGSAPRRRVSQGAVSIATSADPVGAPFFYRDVPLMPSESENGRIKPLGDKAIPLIGWRLRDVSMPGSKLVLEGLPSCGNCHSFSRDGTTLGMDVDGPSGDKGMYAVKALSQHTVIGRDDVLTWNSFERKPEGHKTIGFLSRISPDGAKVVSTVNEALYVTNFTNYRFLQVFYPTRGILAWWDRADGRIRALPGADDPEYVHAGAVWTPDGEELIFMRATACDPAVPGVPPPRYPNDPNELPMRYDLYRIPFAGGTGGEPVAIAGASGNGMSNTFPKVSPDGKWLVWTQCRNGLLLRPDSRLWIAPLDGSRPARKMTCNLEIMNSWHSFSPNGRWLVFTSKDNRPYTQAFLTHIDEDGNDSPAILVPHCTASNRAVNLPEFLNAPYDALDGIDVPAVEHHGHYLDALAAIRGERYEDALASLEKALDVEADFARAHYAMGHALDKMGRTAEALPYLERAVELDPSQLVSRLKLGIAYTDAGLPRRALAVFDALLDDAPWFEVARVAAEDAHAKLQAGERAAVDGGLPAGER